MPYKNLDKRRETDKLRQARHRAKKRGVTLSTENVTFKAIAAESVLPVTSTDIGILPDGMMEMLKRDTEWLLSIGAEPPGSPNVQARLQAMRRVMRPTIPG